MRRRRCPDPSCRKLTDGIDACEHCGCPLTQEGLAALVDGLHTLTLDVARRERRKRAAKKVKGAV